MYELDLRLKESKAGAVIWTDKVLQMFFSESNLGEAKALTNAVAAFASALYCVRPAAGIEALSRETLVFLKERMAKVPKK